MGFTVASWKQQIKERLTGWKARMQSAGVNSVYAFIATASVWPVVEAARAGDWAALTALGSMVGSVGTNLLANMIQGWKDEADAALQLETAVTTEEGEQVRAEIDTVLEQLGSFDLANEQLAARERQWFRDTLHDELQQFGNLERFQAQINGPGVIAQGAGAKAANMGGVVGESFERCTIVTGGSPTFNTNEAGNQNPATARERYLHRLWRRCNSLPLSTLGGDEEWCGKIGLDKLYVELNLKCLIPVPKAERDKLDHIPVWRLLEGEKPLKASEAARQYDRLVLLGDPGSGKSTFIKQLAASMAGAWLKKSSLPEGWSEPYMPLWFNVSKLVGQQAGARLDTLGMAERSDYLIAGLRRYWQAELQDLQAKSFADELETLLDRGKVLLFFDGLDEVPENSRKSVRQMIEAVETMFARGNRIIVTCRIRSYHGDSVIPDFDRQILAPFDDEQIGLFIKGWHENIGNLDEVEKRLADLKKAALGSDMKKLAENPMLLTVMAIIHQREVRLPKERVRLYKEIAEVLMRRWQKGKGNGDISDALAAILENDLMLYKVMEYVAYLAHETEAAGRGEAALERKELLAQLEKRELLGETVLASEFLDYIDMRAGLLAGRGGGGEKHPQTYIFPHRTLQEYLAGCRMIDGRGIAREFRQRAVEGDFWQVAVQLGAEELLFNRRGDKSLLETAYSLCPAEEPSGGAEWRANLWSGQMVLLAGVEAVVQDDFPGGGASFLQRLNRHLVETLQQTHLGPIERAEAGRVLAKLGDSRKGVGLDRNGLPDIDWVEIEKGPFVMGEEKKSYTHDQDYGYDIGRYPITNAQFRAFVKADGYREHRYWGAAIAAMLWGRDGFTVSAPEDYGELFNLDNHPVVGVSWYEAMAFCAWLTEVLRQVGRLDDNCIITLPNEPEWEKAARGKEGSLYPWGNDPDPNLANCDETGIDTTSAMGCFPKGASLYGVEEMSGNVWEWTRSLWGEDWQKPGFDYPYKLEDGREEMEASPGMLWVLRGGSFVFDYRLARCAYRFRYDPLNRFMDIGFRVVSLPISDSDL